MYRQLCVGLLNPSSVVPGSALFHALQTIAKKCANHRLDTFCTLMSSLYERLILRLLSADINLYSFLRNLGQF